MANYIIVNAEPGKAICLGREGENLARQVVFDLYEWQELYGEGVVQLIAQRMGDTQPYPCVVEMDGNHAVWTITNADTAKPGTYGKCELSYYVGEMLVKSETWPTIVLGAMCEPSEETPEPYQAYIDKMLSVGAHAEAERIKAEKAATASEQSSQNSAKSAEDAALFKRNAQMSEKQALEAATRAEALARQVGVNGGLQADLAQSNPAAPGYVHNRTHWIEYECEETIPETTGDCTGGKTCLIYTPFTLVYGDKYRVTYNGVEYVCTCGYANNDTTTFYNLRVRGVFSLNTNRAESNTTGVFYALDGATNVTFSVEHVIGETVHPLPLEFLPKHEHDHTHSWDELEDKPFVVKTEGSDTLKWDGNTEGLISVDFTDMKWGALYKVSDAVEISKDDLTPGYTFCSNGTVYAYNFADKMATGVLSATTAVFFVSEEGVGVDIANSDTAFPEPGVYFREDVSWITIPDYAGFPKEVIDPDCLPSTVVQNGDTEIILTSPNGTTFCVTVGDDGTLTTTIVE